LAKKSGAEIRKDIEIDKEAPAGLQGRRPGLLYFRSLQDMVTLFLPLVFDLYSALSARSRT